MEEEEESHLLVFAIKCLVRVPCKVQDSVAKVRMVARQPLTCLCPWITRGRSIISFKFERDGWRESPQGGVENLSGYFFTNMRVLETYGGDWPVEVQLKSKWGMTLLRRRIVLGHLRKKMVRHLRKFNDFHMVFNMDFTAPHFEVVGGVAPCRQMQHQSSPVQHHPAPVQHHPTPVQHHPAPAATLEGKPKKRRRRGRRGKAHNHPDEGDADSGLVQETPKFNENSAPVKEAPHAPHAPPVLTQEQCGKNRRRRERRAKNRTKTDSTVQGVG